MWMIPDKYRCEATTKAVISRGNSSLTTAVLRCVHLRGHLEDTNLPCGFIVPGDTAPTSMIQLKKG